MRVSHPRMRATKPSRHVADPVDDEAGDEQRQALLVRGEAGEDDGGDGAHPGDDGGRPCRSLSASTSVQTSRVCGSAGVAIARHHVLRRGHLRQAHRPAGVQLLGGDADLGAEAELAAVGEPGRRVDHDRGGVDRGDEPPRGRLRVGDDRLGVAGAVAPDVRDARVEVGRRRPPTMSSERYSVPQSSSVAGTTAASSAGERRSSPCTVTPASAAPRTTRGRNASATSACTSSDSAALQTDGPLGLGVEQDRAAPCRGRRRRRRRRGSCRRRSR